MDLSALVSSGMCLARLVEQAAAQYCQVWSPERRHHCDYNGLATYSLCLERESCDRRELQ
jgi:hypothetical protein